MVASVPPGEATVKEYFGYGCPACRAHNDVAVGWKRAGTVCVRCGECGAVERFEEYYLADDDRGGKKVPAGRP